MPRNKRHAPDADHDAAPARASSANKLTTAQKRLLVELLARYHFSAIVLAEARELDSDFPDLGRAAIQHYRDQIKAGTYDEWLPALLSDEARAGLTSRDARLRQLELLYVRLCRVPLYEEVALVDGKGAPLLDERGKPRRQTVFNDANSRERRAVLEQIAKECGGYNRQQIDATMSGSLAVATTAIDHELARQDLAVLLAGLAETSTAMATAMAGAQRPGPEDADAPA